MGVAGRCCRPQVPRWCFHLGSPVGGPLLPLGCAATLALGIQPLPRRAAGPVACARPKSSCPRKCRVASSPRPCHCQHQCQCQHRSRYQLQHRCRDRCRCHCRHPHRYRCECRCRCPYQRQHPSRQRCRCPHRHKCRQQPVPWPAVRSRRPIQPQRFPRLTTRCRTRRCLPLPGSKQRWVCAHRRPRCK